MTYRDIISHYEACLDRHGDTHLGVDWPRKEDVAKRYRVMLDLVCDTPESVSLLDFGCGAAHLYEYIVDRGITKIHYSGLDISDKFITLCRAKHPGIPFFCTDILSEGALVPQTDYIVMNGVFTEKRSMSHAEMFAYFQLMLKKIFIFARKGVAFNVMSTQVDWIRDDLFYLALDDLTSFVTQHLGRNFVVRSDYGLYEYTVYLYREPRISN
jgi:SAM-dependent methyltransferase